MKNHHVFVFALLLTLACAQADAATRGGWAEPAEGWDFVEEFSGGFTLPPGEGPGEELHSWKHDNGSDEYSGNANNAAFATAGWAGGDVLRIDTVPGVGDTEDGVNPATDATVLTLIDLGDPRDDPAVSISDPSDRKIYLQHILFNPDGTSITRPFVNGGVTILFRFRVFNTSEGDGIANGSGDPVDFDTVTFVPEASDRVNIGLGYVDLGPDPPEGNYNFSLGSGYYVDQTLNVMGNDTTAPDGDENPVLANPIDPTQFHSVWLTGVVVDPVNNPHVIKVTAYVDGGLTPAFEGDILRRSLPGVEGPNPEDDGSTGVVNTHTEQTHIELGSGGTGTAGAFQYDYVCVNTSFAILPQGASSVKDWTQIKP